MHLSYLLFAHVDGIYSRSLFEGYFSIVSNYRPMGLRAPTVSYYYRHFSYFFLQKYKIIHN